jgi:hypothetical protein
MNTLDVISYALLAMITIKFVDDVIRAEPSLTANRKQLRLR